MTVLLASIEVLVRVGFGQFHHLVKTPVDFLIRHRRRRQPRAVGRGLPFYAVGVRLLFEGMTRIAASSKPANDADGFGAAFDIVRRLALRVDLRQTFTVVRLK